MRERVYILQARGDVTAWGPEDTIYQAASSSHLPVFVE